MKILLLCLFLSFCFAASANIEIRAPLCKTVPIVDGIINVDEWQSATRVDGFAMNGQLEKRRATGWVGATQDTLYFAIRTQLPDEGELISQTARNSQNLVFDDSLELWLDPTPGAKKGKQFQVLTNSLGQMWSKMHPYGGTPDELAWKPDWQRATKIHDGFWDYEFAIPINSIAPNRKATDGAWGFNLTRNWKNEWAFSSVAGLGLRANSAHFFC